MGKFKKQYIIPYYETHKSGRVTPISLLKYLGETSGDHSDYNDIGIDELRKNNYGWVLYKWKARFEHYPKAKDKITIETWTSGFNKFYANREFIIYDDKGKEIGRATTLWIFLDINRKRPIRIPSEFAKIYDIIDEKVLDDFVELEEAFDISKELDFYVRKFDIDYNNHVNNVIYLEWILETIPEEIEKDYFLNEFEIVYKKETLYGDFIISQRDKGIFKEDYIIFNHSIVNKEINELKTIGKTIWKKK